MVGLQLTDQDLGALRVVVAVVCWEKDPLLEVGTCLVMDPGEDSWERDLGMTGDSHQEEVHGSPQLANNNRREVTALGPLSTMARRSHQARQEEGRDNRDHNSNRET